MWHRLRVWLRTLVRPGATQREIDEEMQFHIGREIERQLARGVSPEEARFAAIRAFGNVTALREQARDAWTARGLERSWQDVRYATRTLRRTPAFTSVVILSLALGIGVNTAIFRVADALLYRPLPVPAPDRIITVEQRLPDGRRFPNFAYGDYERFLARTTIFSGMTATTWADGFNVVSSGPGGAVHEGAERISIVTGNFFIVLGVRPALGRLLTDSDDRVQGAHPLAVISDGYWARRFERSRDVIGRTLTVNGTTLVIIGVTPRAFGGDWIGWPTDFWVPIAMQAEVTAGAERGGPRGGYAQFKLLGRLQPGATAASARAALEPLHRQLAREKARGSGVVAEASVDVVSAARGYSSQREAFTKPLTTLLVLVVVLLLIACANVASLSLARATARRREIALRLALGASRGRVTRQLLTESTLLALLGTSVGGLLALIGMPLLASLIASGPATSVFLGMSSAMVDLHPDARMLAFVLVACVVTVCLFGLAPAVLGARVSLASSLAAGARGADAGAAGVNARRALVVIQVALSLVLLVGASVFVRTLSNLRREELGAAHRARLLMVWTLPGQTTHRGERLRSLVAAVHERLASLPGVVAVGESGTGLLTGSTGGPTVWAADGAPNAAGAIAVDGSMTVGPRFFEVIGQPLLAGREFLTPDADTSARVVIVNASLATRLFGGPQQAVGRHLATGPAGRGPSYAIVGVVGDARYRSPRQAAGLMTYWPLLNSGRAPRVTFIIQTAGDPGALVPLMRREVRAIEPSLPVLDVDTVDQQLAALLFRERLTANITLFVGALALMLASVGLFGVVSYVAGRRSGEIAIRMALGAPRAGVLRMVLGDSVRLVVAGTVIGVPLAAALRRLLDTLAYGVPAADVGTFATTALLLLLVAILAALLPARRATLIDPASALRTE